MKITENWHLGIIFIIISVLCLTLSAFLSSINFLGTPYGDSFGHVMIYVVPLLLGIGLSILGVTKIFTHSREIDHTKLNTPINFKSPKKRWIILGISIGVFYFLVRSLTVFYNTSIEYEHEYNTISREKLMLYNEMWKEYHLYYDVHNISQEMFIEVVAITMCGNSDSKSKSWELAKNKYQVSYEIFKVFYHNLTKFIADYEHAYTLLEERCLNIVTLQNSSLEVFPNNVYNKMFKIERLEHKPITLD